MLSDIVKDRASQSGTIDSYFFLCPSQVKLNEWKAFDFFYKEAILIIHTEVTFFFLITNETSSSRMGRSFRMFCLVGRTRESHGIFLDINGL